METPNILDNLFEVSMDRAAVLLRHYTDAGQPVFLWGKPGIGKTDIVHQLGQETNRKVIEFHAALREPVDVRGVPSVVNGLTRWNVPDELPRAERDGEFGYLFLDEFNQANLQMQSVLGGLVLYGTVGDYHLPKGWRVIAAGNRVSDRAAAQRMPTHIKGRFQHIACTVSVEAWAKWASANGVAPEVVAFVRFRPELIHRMPRGDEAAYPSPRTIVKAAAHIDAPAEIRQQLFAGCIGCDVAGELNGYIALYRSIGTLEDIIENPTKAKVPVEPSEQYAVCTGLARLATRKNFGQIIKYADRLDGERKMIVMSDATARDPLLKETSHYSKWAVENPEMILQS